MRNMGMLVSWATLQSLDKIRRNLAKPDLVSLVWRMIEGKEPWVLTILVPNYEDCIGSIISCM